MAVSGIRARVLSFARRVRDGSHITEVAADPGGGPNVTLDAVSAPGDDSPPLPTDYVFGVASVGTGRVVAVGFVDPLNAGEAEGGEKRFVGRDPVGNIVCTIWLKGDGSVEASNAAGSVTLDAEGAFEASNAEGSVTLDAAGAFEASNAAGSVALDAAGAFEAANALGSVKLDAAGVVSILAVALSVNNGPGVLSLDASGTWTINGAIITPTGDVVTALGRSLDLHTHPQANDSGGDTQVPTGPPL